MGWPANCKNVTHFKTAAQLASEMAHQWATETAYISWLQREAWVCLTMQLAALCMLFLPCADRAQLRRAHGTGSSFHGIYILIFIDTALGCELTIFYPFLSMHIIAHDIGPHHAIFPVVVSFVLYMQYMYMWNIVS